MSTFTWALIGPGGIAHRFAEAVQAAPDAHLGVVLGRDVVRAGAFAARWTVARKPVPRVAPSLTALLEDGQVDGVYIATPHSAHGDLVRACLLAGKPVLCEKPLVPDLATALMLTRLAQERGVFLMEALWTRFLPIYGAVRGWLADGAIGRLQAIQSSFCFAATADPDSRLFNPALAGGALLDIGIYNIAMSRWAIAAVHGQCPAASRMQVDGVLAPTGVDERVVASLHFPGDISAQFVCAFDGDADNSLALFGSAGSIRVARSFWEATRATLHRPGRPEEPLHLPFRVNGFEYEVDEAMRCIRKGLIESPTMPHAETLATLACMDELRARLGVRYPFESPTI